MKAPASSGADDSEAAVSELHGYADRCGVTFTRQSIRSLLKRRGQAGARSYIADLGAIMDAAAIVGCDCAQTRAVRRLALAGGDAQAVVDEFSAQRRRRIDRLTARCAVPVPPRTLAARSNAYAGCGCPHCLRRLAHQLERYIEKMVSAGFFTKIERDEARAEANLELVDSVDAWPGGPNFTGWFSLRFKRRVQAIYRSRSKQPSQISLDAGYLFTDGEGGRIVPLYECVPDRNTSVERIVILRERRSEQELELRTARLQRTAEFEMARCPTSP